MPKRPTKEQYDKKQMLPIARVTTFLRGSTKNKFFDEIKRTGCTEACLASEIIIRYYNK